MLYFGFLHFGPWPRQVNPVHGQANTAFVGPLSDGAGSRD
jgi:hypothetical protein